MVTSQTPSPGARVPTQTTVRLFFYESEQGESVEVPDVLGLSMRDASTRLADDGLRITIVGSGLAVKQVPAAGVQIPKGSAVEVIFSL